MFYHFMLTLIHHSQPPEYSQIYMYMDILIYLYYDWKDTHKGQYS